MTLKSPLRYPGGKSRSAGYIVSRFPKFREYREPFLGGASVFIAEIQKSTDVRSYWINDAFYDLYAFWQCLKDSPQELTDEIRKIRESTDDGRELFNLLTSRKNVTMMESAASFFALNRMTFSGTTMSGGFSREAFEKRFTESSIERCGNVAHLLENVRITNLDYSELLSGDGEDVFVFMDPPYCIGDKSKLYGDNGNLHRGFDHDRLLRCCGECRHKWMITYNDCELIREMYSKYVIEEMTLSYGMGKCKTGKEIIIRNYDII